MGEDRIALETNERKWINFNEQGKVVHLVSLFHEHGKSLSDLEQVCICTETIWRVMNSKVDLSNQNLRVKI